MHDVLKTKLEQCSTLPSIPAVAVRVLRLCQQDDLDLRQIADAVGTDPALAAKVLKLVNSPVFGLRQEVKTIPHALALLGVNAIRTLALSFSLVRDLRKTQQKGLQSYWRRSIVAAVAAKELSAALRFPGGDEAFLAALLQDIGVLALGRVAGPDYERVAADAGSDHLLLADLERAAFGADHAEVGAWLAAHWRLPEPLQWAIGASHMDPGTQPPGKHEDLMRLARIVGVSGLIADIWVSQAASAATENARYGAEDLLGLTADKLEPILARTAAAMPQVAALFDFELGTQEEISRVLEQASETLVMMTLKTSQQVMHAQVAIGNLEKKARDLEEASARDALTGLYNRARLTTYLHEQVAMCAQSGKPVSVIMADVDHFKRVNDTYGHPAGDKILIAVAQALGGRLRPRDLAARYGGEEFVLVLPETPAAGAQVVAERVREKIEAATHDVGVATGVRVTLSLGCATYSGEGAPPAGDVLAAADQALYAAKRGGRNRVVIYDPASTPALASEASLRVA